MYLIVGLGNPGIEYRETRHNVGFMVIEKWSSNLGITLRETKLAKDALIQFNDKKVILMCPLTYMNLSGKAVKAYKDYYGIQTEDILVVHDDLDLPVGRVKISRNGGSGGHRGVSSVIEYLGSKEFPRVRIGIGRPRFGEDIVDYVLSPFYEDEWEIVEKVLDVAIEGCEAFISHGIDFAMNKVNSKNLAKGGR